MECVTVGKKEEGGATTELDCYIEYSSSSSRVGLFDADDNRYYPSIEIELQNGEKCYSQFTCGSNDGGFSNTTQYCGSLYYKLTQNGFEEYYITNGSEFNNNFDNNMEFVLLKVNKQFDSELDEYVYDFSVIKTGIKLKRYN